MDQSFLPLALEDSFRFSCAKDVVCFNDCCRDLNQFLTPYDIIRLKTRLNLSSSLFLEQFTTRHTGPETGLPVIAFKTDPGLNHVCPFVTPAGCRIYEDRPASCRMYPLARAISRSRKTGKITEHFALLKESHCQGHRQSTPQTVAAWIDAQGLRPYNTHNDLIMELIYRKNQLKPGPLAPEASQRFHLALYDLDSFRNRAFQSAFFKQLTIDRPTYEQARQDDTALLKVGINWLAETVLKWRTP